MQNQNLKNVDDALDNSKEVEAFPGRFERRYFLTGSVSSIAAVAVMKAFGVRTLGQQSYKALLTPTADLAWDDFIKAAVPVAQQLIADANFPIDEYLYRIGSLATRLKEIPDSRLGPYTSVDSRVWFGPSFRGAPFFIIQWRMEPGAFLPPHNHPNASVCTVGFAGEVRLRNFEIVGESHQHMIRRRHFAFAKRGMRR